MPPGQSSGLPPRGYGRRNAIANSHFAAIIPHLSIRGEIRAEREREEQERDNRAAMQGLTAAANNAAPQTGEGRANITEEQAANAVNRLVQRYGEQYRREIERAIETFRRTGDFPRAYLTQLSQALGENNPIVQEANRASQARMTPAERDREAVQNAIYSSLTPSARQANAKAAAAVGVSVADHALGKAQRVGGYDCYLQALAYSARQAGIDIPRLKYRPSGYGLDAQRYFLPTKLAMKNAGWTPVQGATYEETVRNLEELVSSKPDGYTIECWGSNHHGTQAVLFHGQWYRSDVFGGTFNQPCSSSELARFISPFSRNTAVASLDGDQRRIVALAALKHLDPVRRASMSQAEKDEYVNSEVPNALYYAESSFGHGPDQPFTEELLRAMLA